MFFHFPQLYLDHIVKLLLTIIARLQGYQRALEVSLPQLAIIVLGNIAKLVIKLNFIQSSPGCLLTLTRNSAVLRTSCTVPVTISSFWRSFFNPGEESCVLLLFRLCRRTAIVGVEHKGKS